VRDLSNLLHILRHLLFHYISILIIDGSALIQQDIPAPRSSAVQSYAAEQSPDFKLPVAYIRFPKRAANEEDYSVREYSLLLEDEQWLSSHPKYGATGTVSIDQCIVCL
jgi:hypothetical protein